MKIFINTPKLTLRGGVANNYNGLKPYFSENVIYNEIGKRTENTGLGVLWLPYDIVKFFIRLKIAKPDVVLLNPSLNKSALARDFFFLRISKLLHCKTAVYIHGFDWNYAKKSNHSWVVRNLNRADLIFVLANQFKEELIRWKVKTPIILQTSKVDDRLVKNFNINSRTGAIRKLLFLSRIEKGKGIYESINTYSLLKKKYPELCLKIVGSGSELAEVKKYIKKKDIKDVEVAGQVSVKDLINYFKESDAYIFPTFYGEGLPTSVLEAMAFGLPVFTRYVGGLCDFFENERMGFITNSLDPQDFANAISMFIQDAVRTRDVCIYNFNYAKEHFMASKVARTLENDLKTII